MSILRQENLPWKSSAYTRKNQSNAYSIWQSFLEIWTVTWIIFAAIFPWYTRKIFIAKSVTDFYQKKCIFNDINKIYYGNHLRTPRKNCSEYYLCYCSYFQERLPNRNILFINKFIKKTYYKNLLRTLRKKSLEYYLCYRSYFQERLPNRIDVGLRIFSPLNKHETL